MTPQVAEEECDLVLRHAEDRLGERPGPSIGGNEVARWVASAHLLVGYTVLGLLVSRKRS